MPARDRAEALPRRERAEGERGEDGERQREAGLCYALAALSRHDKTLHAAAILVALFALARPFWSATYPPLTDLPFHAAQTSVFRHYFDASYHFRDQFELHPLEVPYISSYVLGALLMIVFDAVTATKIATVLMLACLPAGLATLAWGARRSPLIGLAGLPFAFGTLTHWGFINFVAALGMFAAALGLALRALDRPSRRNQAALALTLLALFFTHVFRFPYALFALGAATLACYPLTRRWRPVVLPALPAASLFALFVLLRPKAVGGAVAFGLHIERLRELFGLPVGSFNDPWEPRAAWVHLAALACVVVLSVLPHRPKTDAFALRAKLVTLLCVGSFLISFLVLPMEIGVWWYVYPREATTTLFLALALLPDLPREGLRRAAAVTLLAGSALFTSGVVATNYRLFERATADFRSVSAQIGPHPKLLYLVFDHSGSTRKNTPFIHLPAYIQADRGGWLSFHFAGWGTSPVRYRADREAIVPPPVPPRWEWTPNVFRLRQHGAFFDTFLVRATRDPAELFASDKRIVEVAHEGTWWLYRRSPAALETEPVPSTP